jgi:hypothetical protein
MKEEEIKEALKEDFLKKAPEGFTNKLMLKIEYKKKEQVHLLPASTLRFIFVTSAIFILTSILVLYKKEGIQIPLDTYLASYYQVAPLLILPSCIASLYFMKELFHYRKTQ